LDYRTSKTMRKAYSVTFCTKLLISNYNFLYGFDRDNSYRVSTFGKIDGKSEPNIYKVRELRKFIVDFLACCINDCLKGNSSDYTLLVLHVI
jgi:hypothetical protein